MPRTRSNREQKWDHVRGHYPLSEDRRTLRNGRIRSEHAHSGPVWLRWTIENEKVTPINEAFDFRLGEYALIGAELHTSILKGQVFMEPDPHFRTLKCLLQRDDFCDLLISEECAEMAQLVAEML
jgi:hypothetical protein